MKNDLHEPRLALVLQNESKDVRWRKRQKKKLSFF